MITSRVAIDQNNYKSNDTNELIAAPEDLTARCQSTFDNRWIAQTPYNFISAKQKQKLLRPQRIPLRTRIKIDRKIAPILLLLLGAFYGKLLFPNRQRCRILFRASRRKYILKKYCIPTDIIRVIFQMIRKKKIPSYNLSRSNELYSSWRYNNTIIIVPRVCFS